MATTKKRWVVRVVTDVENTHDEQLVSGPLIESLRYAGLVVVHRDDAKGMCFDILPPARPANLDTQVWAHMQATRMQSMLVNAVAAPEML